jgi:subtilisin
MQPVSDIRAKICMVMVVTLVVGWTSVARAENLRRIVIFLPGTPLPLLVPLVQPIVQVVHPPLSLIDALAIELPQDDPLGALTRLLDLVGDVVGDVVVGVFDDPVGVADSITALPLEQEPQEESYSWGQVRINVPVVHHDRSELQGIGVTIAVLDTGIDSRHPELRQNVAGGFNAQSRERSYNDGNGHGTHIAGIIAAAEDDRGVVGVAPQAKLLAVKVLDDRGHGHVSDVVHGLQWVYNNRSRPRIRLVNMSLGFFEDNVPLERATKRLYDSGMIMVASAGNRACPPGQTEGGGDDGEDAEPECDTSQLTVKSPARYPWVIAVAATDVDDKIPDYSLSGPEVDMVAPGGARANEQILSTNRGGGYGRGSGTSQAAAHTTGAVALALQQDPRLYFEQVLRFLKSTASELRYPEEKQGAGLINVQKLMEALQ